MTETLQSDRRAPPEARGAAPAGHGMREVRIGSLVDYIEFIAGLTERVAFFRGAKDPVEDMKPTVVRSWQRNRRIRRDAGGEARRRRWADEAGRFG